MGQTKNYFRIIVVMTMTVYVIYFCLPFFGTALYSKQELTILGWNGYGAIVKSEGVIPFLWLALYMFFSIGLLYFKTWAKFGYLILTVISIVLSALSGLLILARFDNALLYLTHMGDGAILVLAFLSSVKDNFT
ncbi:MAG: hypothetical protein AAGB35_02150 [Pseudomonadota bacterium]